MRSSGFLRSRDVAQPGRALAWGARGRQFKSARPDHYCLAFQRSTRAACPTESSRTKKNTLIPSAFLRQSWKAVPWITGPQRRSHRVLFKMPLREVHTGRILMSGQVILYFDDQADALRFALAAGSVMAGDDARATDDLVQETTRVSRIRLDAANAGKKPTPERAA
jgi:hypothetical protein